MARLMRPCEPRRLRQGLRRRECADEMMLPVGQEALRGDMRHANVSAGRQAGWAGWASGSVIWAMGNGRWAMWLDCWTGGAMATAMAMAVMTRSVMVAVPDTDPRQAAGGGSRGWTSKLQRCRSEAWHQHRLSAAKPQPATGQSERLQGPAYPRTALALGIWTGHPLLLSATTPAAIAAPGPWCAAVFPLASTAGNALPTGLGAFPSAGRRRPEQPARPCQGLGIWAAWLCTSAERIPLWTRPAVVLPARL
jgi:hypothetical protein